MSLSKEKLLTIARTYWRSDEQYELRGEHSPEYTRLAERWEEELTKISRWWAFLEELEKELPDFTIGDGTATINACFRCLAYSGKNPPHAFAVVGCVSILAPVYMVHGVRYEIVEGERRNPWVSFEPLPPDMRSPADVIARKIETTFGAAALSPELAATPVPLIVQWTKPPETTLFHALFASQPERIP